MGRTDPFCNRTEADYDATLRSAEAIADPFNNEGMVHRSGQVLAGAVTGLRQQGSGEISHCPIEQWLLLVDVSGMKGFAGYEAVKIAIDDQCRDSESAAYCRIVGKSKRGHFTRRHRRLRRLVQLDNGIFDPRARIERSSPCAWYGGDVALKSPLSAEMWIERRRMHLSTHRSPKCLVRPVGHACENDPVDISVGRCFEESCGRAHAVADQHDVCPAVTKSADYLMDCVRVRGKCDLPGRRTITHARTNAIDSKRGQSRARRAN